MSESWYDKQEREAGEQLEKLLAKPIAPNRELILEKLLAKPIAPNRELIGVIDEKTNEPEYFDPWDMFPFYGSYSSEFDDMALDVLENLLEGNRKDETLAHEMFREVLCKKNLCDYGTSPRVCFPTTQFKKLLPELINKWKQYYNLSWKDES